MARKGSGTWFTHVRGAIIVFPWVVWLLLIDISVSALLLIKSLFPNFTYDLSSALAWTVWRWIQWIFEDVNGARVTISGDPLPANGESAVIVANHVSWNDFYMVQAVAVRAGMLGRCRYFAKIQLRAVPFLGWGLWALGMPMVTRNCKCAHFMLDNSSRRRRPSILQVRRDGNRMNLNREKGRLEEI